MCEKTRCLSVYAMPVSNPQTCTLYVHRPTNTTYQRYDTLHEHQHSKSSRCLVRNVAVEFKWRRQHKNSFVRPWTNWARVLKTRRRICCDEATPERIRRCRATGGAHERRQHRFRRFQPGKYGMYLCVFIINLNRNRNERTANGICAFNACARVLSVRRASRRVVAHRNGVTNTIKNNKYPHTRSHFDTNTARINGTTVESRRFHAHAVASLHRIRHSRLQRSHTRSLLYAPLTRRYVLKRLFYASVPGQVLQSMLRHRGRCVYVASFYSEFLVRA